MAGCPCRFSATAVKMHTPSLDSPGDTVRRSALPSQIFQPGDGRGILFWVSGGRLDTHSHPGPYGLIRGGRPGCTESAAVVYRALCTEPLFKYGL